MRVKHKLKVKCNKHYPSYANKDAAGLDLRANNEVPIILKPHSTADVPTKLQVEIPKGHFGMVVPRSGLGFNKRITLINDVGIIDSDYRGEIGIRLINEGDKALIIDGGDRVAQMVIIPYIQPEIVFTDELTNTDRGTKGFGSTGK